LRYLYSVLFYLALPFVFLRLLWRSRHSVEYRKNWPQRLGFASQLEKCIWIHAASVGETLAAIPLIKALKADYPHIPILVTNMTINGAARTKAAFGETVLRAYIPYDLPAFAERFLQRTKPVVAVILETELWPNLFYACHKNHIPIVVANARLSEKSAAGYQRVASLTREMFGFIHTLAVQTEVEAGRFVQLGLPRERVIVTGNIKFDIEVPENLVEKSVVLRRQLGQERLIWIAASTHNTEEEIILAAHKKILEKNPQALLILVPRHPERFDAVFNLIQKQNFTNVRRSSGDTCHAAIQIYLGDTMGELLLLYSVCDVAVIAGSFVPIGGHNMLEAAVLGKPVITGPQLFNFSEISRSLIAAKGMVVVQDSNELAVEVLRLFENKEYRQRMGNNAEEFVMANRGALAKQLQAVKAVLL
jgi:3-deoxy-D-manno-octulosonic-acid transferase